jgi:imidazolonepropionase-like amidohydrolase
MPRGRLVAAGLALALLVSCADDEGTPRRAVHYPRAHGPIRSVRCGVVWDPSGAIEDGRITFDGDRVAAMGPASSTPREGEELDLRPLFCMPGLVDAHTHLTSYAHERGTDDLEKRRKEAARNAALTLHAGITSVRDLGGSEGVDLWLRDRIAAGALPGPRMQCAGAQIGTDGAVGGAAGAKAAVDAHADAGFDVIKLFATGGAPDARPLMTAEELLAATDEAHARHLRVAVHAIGAEGIDRAIAAHVDSIEHGQALTLDQAREMAAAGIALVPTLYILRYYVENAEDLGFSDEYVADLRHTVSETIVPFEHRFPAILETGVKVAMGSDSFMALHGRNARELGYMVKAGMSPERALDAATRTAAELLGWAGKVGSLKPGAYADVIAMNRDPRKDVTAVEHVSVVIAGAAVAYDGRGASD